MHLINNDDANVVVAWCTVLTLLGAVASWAYRRWSKMQDKAIAALQAKLDVLIGHVEASEKRNKTLRSYIRVLLRLLDRHEIDYPDPPDELYEQNTLSEKIELLEK